MNDLRGQNWGSEDSEDCDGEGINKEWGYSFLIPTDPRQNIKKQRHCFADKGPSFQSYSFPSSHVWMLELDCKESWELKNWCFCTVVLQKTLESPLDCKEIQPVHPKGDQSWVFIGRTCWSWNSNTLATWCKELTLGKDPDGGKDWRQEEKGSAEDEMVGWHHWLDRHEFEWTLGVGDGQGGVLQSVGLQSVGHDWVTGLNWTNWKRMGKRL